MHTAGVRVAYAALQLELLKARMFDAAAELHAWAREWLFDDDEDALEDFEREVDLDAIDE